MDCLIPLVKIIDCFAVEGVGLIIMVDLVRKNILKSILDVVLKDVSWDHING